MNHNYIYIFKKNLQEELQDGEKRQRRRGGTRGRREGGCEGGERRKLSADVRSPRSGRGWRRPWGARGVGIITGARVCARHPVGVAPSGA